MVTELISPESRGRPRLEPVPRYRMHRSERKEASAMRIGELATAAGVNI